MSKLPDQKSCVVAMGLEEQAWMMAGMRVAWPRLWVA
jgi:hypothetical protein